MIAFIKEGSCACFWALLTSWSQYLRRETEHSEEQRVHHRETGEGGVGGGPSLQGALWGPIDAGWLLTGLLKDEQCRLWSTRETGLERKVPDSGNKFLLRFAGLKGHEQLSRADIHPSRDPTSGDRARHSGLWLWAPFTSADAEGTRAPLASKVG